jgi:dsRNA-specific ribonuclease
VLTRDYLAQVAVATGLHKRVAYNTREKNQKFVRNVFAETMEAYAGAVFYDGGADEFKKIVNIIIDLSKGR